MQIALADNPLEAFGHREACKRRQEASPKVSIITYEVINRVDYYAIEEILYPTASCLLRN